MSDPNPLNVQILGAGSIGCAFAAVFRDAGASVCLVEPDAEARNLTEPRVEAQAEAIQLAGLTRGGGGMLELRAAVEDDVAHADLVLECGPEQREIKAAIFADLLTRAAPDAVLASASSAIPMSKVVPDPSQQRRCLVAHPANPPSVLRVIELTPCDGTSEATTRRARTIFEGAGFSAVTLHREIEGFIMNRLQGAVLREAYRLVDDGITTATDIDTVMRLSLGPRWAFSGPFETAELNTPGGIAAHAARLGPAYKRMGEARGESVDWHPDLLAQVERERRKALPADQIPARAKWRTQAVARLIAQRDRIARGEDD
ncbi:3-hydroxyacyl-CoA dehydrogenase NAD-binding domain-containing protein [Ovoidimarina sediminis]|uniref:3-hydroxyacyl-CoA dehydrogenase NAD-binding domain-containing protein n=1 Tax=Ovoidimarina sediminis TaxID=3079856 RepID=UPI002912CDF9|nr:3-hydroxyacyl-CoA dehydrogenase NAD-binding domain-containing protein [Rhodophyticola sp. MJ-SS7]MDU8944227.1 3-hydroxyacyl-CoA dehydrogenase NAD-binding domain-containing protein [Rhodophyticola sp. MJ-SS7]